MTILRLEPRDDYMHPVDDAANFNESMYFNVFDPQAGIGGFLRLGNRPNEGYAEMTACVYLPAGRVAFSFARPEIAHNDAFDAGGMRFDVLEPMKRLTVAFEGNLCILDDPLQMADPKKAFTQNPWTDAVVRLEYEAVSPAHGGEPPSGEQTNEFARGHYVQHLAVRGSIRVGVDRWTIDGLGVRDHSWGPRWWQSPWWYRWLVGNVGRDAGMVVSVIGARDGSRRIGGVILEGGAYDPIADASIDTEWDGPDLYHRKLRARVRTASGREHDIEGEVLSLIPLRNRREGGVTRITEGLTQYRMGGRVGYGLSEYLDQIVDGVPVGAGV